MASYYIECDCILSEVDYIDIIDWCFQYSTCFSLLVSTHKETSIFDDFKDFVVLKHEIITFPSYTACFEDYAQEPIPSLYLIRCCQESKKAFYKQKRVFIAPFSSINFYRSNKKTFLYTSDAVCYADCSIEEFNKLRYQDKWKTY